MNSRQYNNHMSQLLETAIEKARNLPEPDQDRSGGVFGSTRRFPHVR
jgi:hypothetical protein